MTTAITENNTASPLAKRFANYLSKIQIGYIEIDGLINQQFGDKNSELKAKITLRSNELFKLIIKEGAIGAAESFLQGHWEVDDLVTLMRILIQNQAALERVNGHSRARFSKLKKLIWYLYQRKNSISGSKRNIADHYDLSNDLFELFLDDTMMYSSAIYHEEDDTLEQAQEQKLRRICEQLQLKPNDHVLEIGTGWGGFSIFAAREYGCKVTTTTISQEQYNLAKQRVEAAGLGNKITLLLDDYRELTGTFDKLVSIEMIEAVGHQYLDTYFNVIHQRLKPGGEALIQAITIEDTRYQKALKEVDFIKRYIFPGSFIPCNRILVDSAANNGLKLHNLHDIGLSYALTLREWRRRFFLNIDDVTELGFDERFVRMWDFYLCYCEAGFLEQRISDVQLHYKNNMALTV